MDKINLNEKFSLFEETWTPKIVGDLNESYIKLGKLSVGEFVWHTHDNEDEMFYVVEGMLDILFEDKTVSLEPGEFIIVPKGIKHKPVAITDVKIMLIESKATVNTGGVESVFTKTELDWI